MSKEDKSLELLDFISERTEIECSICQRKEEDDGAALDGALDAFYKLGWRQKKGVVKCPSCVKTDGKIQDRAEKTIIWTSTETFKLPEMPQNGC